VALDVEDDDFSVFVGELSDFFDSLFDSPFDSVEAVDAVSLLESPPFLPLRA